MKNGCFLLLVLLPIISCSPIKEIERTDRIYIDEQNMQLLAGIYESMPVRAEETNHLSKPISVTDKSERNFLFDRFRLTPTKSYADSAAKYVVELEPLNARTIQLSLMEGTEIIKTKKLKGRYRDGYFYSRRQLIVVPFIPVLFGYRVQRQRIGLEAGKLVVDLRQKIWVSFLVAGRAENSQQEAKYNRIEKQ